MSNVIPLDRKKERSSTGKKSRARSNTILLDERAMLLAALFKGLSTQEVEDRLGHIEVCLKHAIDQLEGALDSVKVLRK